MRSLLHSSFRAAALSAYVYFEPENEKIHQCNVKEFLKGWKASEFKILYLSGFTHDSSLHDGNCLKDFEADLYPSHYSSGRYEKYCNDCFMNSNGYKFAIFYSLNGREYIFKFSSKDEDFHGSYWMIDLKGP